MLWLPKRRLWTPEQQRIQRARKKRSRRGFFVNPCCCGCVAFADSFDRADETPPTGWDLISGTWGIVGNVLTTSTINGVLLFNQASGSPHDSTFSVEIKPGSVGDQLRCISNYVDASNYLFVELTAGDEGTLAIYKRVAGAITLIGSGTVYAPAATISRLTVTFADDRYTVAHEVPYVAPAPVTREMIGWPGVAASGTRVGLGTGATHAALASNFNLWNGKFCETTPLQCSLCPTVRILRVVIAGVTNGSCAMCADWNATIDMPFVCNTIACQRAVTTGICTWDPANCGGLAGPAKITSSLHVISGFEIDVIISECGGVECDSPSGTLANTVYRKGDFGPDYCAELLAGPVVIPRVQLAGSGQCNYPASITAHGLV